MALHRQRYSHPVKSPGSHGRAQTPLRGPEWDAGPSDQSWSTPTYVQGIGHLGHRLCAGSRTSPATGCSVCRIKTEPGGSTQPQHHGQGMLCSADHVRQGLCNTLPEWCLASEVASPMQLWAPEGQERSWKHLQAAGSCTPRHMPSAVGCADPSKHLNPISPLSLLLSPRGTWGTSSASTPGTGG